MNCDEAFECLTDTTRANSTALKRHLAGCARCRQMREVLSPALEALIAPTGDCDGQSDDDARSDGERYRSAFHSSQDGDSRRPPLFLSAHAVQVAERAAKQVSSISESARNAGKTRCSRLSTFLRYAAVFLIGAAVTLTAAGAVFDRNSDESPGAEGCVWVHGKEAQTQKGDSSRSLVLSCVACHISGTVD